jgi:hypothetical protein
MKIESTILVQVLQSIERLENGRSLVISMVDNQLCVEPWSELIDPQRAREPQISDHGPRGNFLTTTGVLEVATEDEATEDEIASSSDPTSDEESEDNKAFSDAEKSVVVIDDSSESSEERDTLPPLNSKRKDQSRKVEILEESSDEAEIAYEFSQKQDLAYMLFEE